MLTVRDKMTLDLEARRFKYMAAKDAVVRDLFSETPTRYYQRLNTLLGRPEALAYAPTLVRRLQRLQATRQSVRRGLTHAT